MEFSNFYFVALVIVGFFMAMGVGANDVANAMGTSVGSKSLTIRQAVLIAAIFELAGAILAGGNVTNTLSNDIVLLNEIADPNIVICGMFSASLATALWLLWASYKGLPVSTTHTIVGAIVGFGIVHLGTSAVNWSTVLKILASWVLAPVLAGCLSFMFFMSVKKMILDTDSPYKHAVIYIPRCTGLSSLFLVTIIVKQILQSYFLIYELYIVFLISVPLSVLAYFVARRWVLIRSIDVELGKFIEIAKIEELFKFLMVFTASAMAFAHGSNDVSNAIGPLAAVVNVLENKSLVMNYHTPVWVLCVGGLGIVTGLVLYGYKVMITIGKYITELTPSRGYAAELSTASIVIIASSLGLPVSSTQTLVGAILGVGFARGINAINLGVVQKIFMTWFITVPMGATLSALIYFIIGYFLL